MSEKIEFETRVDEAGDECYYLRKKFPSGMTAECGYWLNYDTTGTHVMIYPYLTVFHKRKKRWPDDPTQTTGKDGLAPAIWAAGCLEAMVEDVRGYFEHLPHTHVRVLVGWADTRRRDAYAKYLARKGFYFNHYDNAKYLEKVVAL